MFNSSMQGRGHCTMLMYPCLIVTQTLGVTYTILPIDFPSHQLIHDWWEYQYSHPKYFITNFLYNNYGHLTWFEAYIQCAISLADVQRGVCERDELG